MKGKHGTFIFVFIHMICIHYLLIFYSSVWGRCTVSFISSFIYCIHLFSVTALSCSEFWWIQSSGTGTERAGTKQLRLYKREVRPLLVMKNTHKDSFSSGAILHIVSDVFGRGGRRTQSTFEAQTDTNNLGSCLNWELGKKNKYHTYNLAHKSKRVWMKVCYGYWMAVLSCRGKKEVFWSILCPWDPWNLKENLYLKRAVWWTL